jgi:glycosyltransferase involved in cell wall biosynthesis
VVDNCSTDRTWEICQQWSEQDGRVRVFRNETNLGPVRNWSRGVSLSRGEFVKILWSDDLINPAFLEKTLPFLKDNDDVGFVFTEAAIFAEGRPEVRYSHAIGQSGLYSCREFIYGSLLGKNWPVSPGCALFRKKDLSRNLLVDVPNRINSDFSQHAIGNDVLIFLLTASAYPSCYFIAEPLSRFREHGSSISTSTDKSRLILLYLVAKAYFVENFVEDGRLRRRFNAILLSNLKRYNNNPLGVREIKDFYPSLDNCTIDRIFFAKHHLRKKIYDFVSRYMMQTK